MLRKLKQRLKEEAAANPPVVHIQGGLRTTGGSAVQPVGSQFIHMNTDQFLQHLRVDDD
jgi:hypothetical protein